MMVMLVMSLAVQAFAVQIGSRVPGKPGVVYSSEDGTKLAPAPGYEWANNKPGDFSVRKKQSSWFSRSSGVSLSANK